MDDRGYVHELTPESLAALDPEYRKGLTPIPPEQAEAVRGMNRKQRRAWLANHRRALRAAPRGSKT